MTQGNTKATTYLNLPSHLGKFGALFASIPFTIFAAVYCVLFGIVGTFSCASQCSKPVFDQLGRRCLIYSTSHCLFPAAVGLSLLQFTNMNSMRNLFIAGVSIFLGLSVPQYFFRYTTSAPHGPAHTKAEWVSIRTFFFASLTNLARFNQHKQLSDDSIGRNKHLIHDNFALMLSYELIELYHM